MDRIDTVSSNMTTIQYDKKKGNIFFVTGLLFLFLALFAFAEFFLIGSMVAGIGIALVVRGFACMVNPAYFTVDERELCIYNFRGRKSQIFLYDSCRNFSVENDKIYLQTNERRKKLPIEKWLCEKNSWKSFIEKISQHDC